MKYAVLIQEPDQLNATGPFDTYDQADNWIAEYVESLDEFDEDNLTSSGYDDGDFKLQVIYFVEQ